MTSRLSFLRAGTYPVSLILRNAVRYLRATLIPVAMVPASRFACAGRQRWVSVRLANSQSQSSAVPQLLRGLAVAQPCIELVDELFGSIGDHRPRREDRLGASLVQCIVILWRHHTANDDHDVVAALLFQSRLQFRYRRKMGCRERGHTQNMHVVLDRLPCRLFGGGKQRPDIDVKANIGESGGDHLLPAIVTVLTDFGDENTRPPSFRVLECV